MNQRHAVVVSLAVSACDGGGGGPKIALRFHPPAGAVYHYALEQRTQISILSGPLAAMGKQHFFLRMPFTQTVKGAAREGGTEVEVVFESLTLEIPGVPPDRIARELAKVNGLRTTVVYDERGQIVRSTFVPTPDQSPEVANQVEMGIKATTLGFPDQPVGRGDSWTITSELPLGQVPGGTSPAGAARTTLTVREIRIAGSDTTVVLDMKTTFPSGPIPLAVGSQTGTVKLDGDLAGHQQFSISRGAILDGTIKGATKVHVAGGMLASKGMDLLTDTESSIFLLPD